MSEQARMRELGQALETAVHADAGAERYQRSQRQLRRARSETADRPRPLEFDRNGFPVAQPRPSFAQRVARLLSP
jgi:hypothetical protein